MVKKNSRRLFLRGRRPVSLPSAKYVAWERVALLYLTRAKMAQNINQPFDFPLHLQCTFSFENHQAEADLGNLMEGIQDSLQLAKIISNDRLVMSLDGSRKIFGGEPSLKCVLFKYDV